LGPGITAEMLHDDCLGRTLDWLYAHDPTALFAGIARQARQRFGISARQVHVDTTSFAVTGEYTADLNAHTLAVTYGYSRDHRADLKQWMLALGCHGPPRGRAMCRCSARRWTAMPVTR
jgi:transposase